ncbi:MAG: 5-formyltetrahydrofolate cyclo-ligase [Gammaproteobacteria bacterium RBG_16_57_12]|nr:MAG: 5-formyltetrahydrofolate cyclo-ligase [Gammaproteobacteria bacterium RBG_16_57_12]
MTTRNQLRQSLREQRRSLPAALHESCATRLARQLGKHPLIRNSHHIACYLANDGELDLLPLIVRLWTMGKICYLPVLDGPHHDRLLFAPYHEGDALRVNRYGIPEPVLPRRYLSGGQALDLVLTPLVAFDMSGNRLGMGGGYYDRTFSFLRHRTHWHRPRLLGIAYELQKVATLECKDWDVPLHAVATEQSVYLMK